jgi:hypothetical protein
MDCHMVTVCLALFLFLTVTKLAFGVRRTRGIRWR